MSAVKRQSERRKKTSFFLLLAYAYLIDEDVVEIIQQVVKSPGSILLQDVNHSPEVLVTVAVKFDPARLLLGG